MAIDKLNEFKLIKNIKKWVSDNDLEVSIGDDAAAFKLDPDKLSLFTADTLVENVHFKINSISPADLGYKSLAVNVSDIAAMGGQPKYAILALSLPFQTDLSFVKDFFKGLNEAANKYSVTIAGGDLTSSEELVVNISILGQVRQTHLLTRSSAKIGDQVLVTGTLGSSAAGLKLALNPSLDVGNKKYFLDKHFRPEAKIQQAEEAASIGVKTAIDISDGLVSDCRHICESSRVGCRLFVEKIPIDNHLLNEAAKFDINPLTLALSGGEDYEIILTAPKNVTEKLIDNFNEKSWPITVIGEIITGDKIEVLDKNMQTVSWEKGYEHFEADIRR